MQTAAYTIEDMAEAVKTARRDMERAKVMYYGNGGTFEDFEAAAKKLANVMYVYQKAKFPAMRVKKVPFQAIMR
jgi:hypothetical protein